MAKKKDFNVLEMDGKIYTVAECVREESNVREIPYTISEYIKEVDSGEICRDPLIQRTDDQWVRKQRSKLIEAVLHNRPIGSIALAKGRAESKSYAVTSLVDGLQRTTALVDFCHDKFVLDKRAKPVMCKIVDESGNESKELFEIAGKKYSQLPDAIKKFFDKYRLTTYMHEGFTDEELDDIVFCMNNGKTPNSYQKIRFLLGSDNMRVLQPICDSVLWEDSKGCKAKNDSILCCVVRILMMMTHYNYTSLGSATMTKFADDDYEDYVKMSTINKLASLVEQLAEIKVNLTGEEAFLFDSITIPHYIIGLDTFNENNSEGKDFTDFLRDFWKSENYKLFLAACDSKGSGNSLYSAESVEDRQYALSDFIDEYLDIADNESENEEGDFIEENGNSYDEETGTESDNAGDREAEINPCKTAFDLGDLSPNGECCEQTSLFEQQGDEDTDNISGCEQTAVSA